MTQPNIYLMLCLSFWAAFQCNHRWWLQHFMHWWHHQIETFSALLALCAGNSPATGEFPSQRPVARSFGVFFDRRVNKRLDKHSRRRWFDPPSCSLWRHCNAMILPGKNPSFIPYDMDYIQAQRTWFFIKAFWTFGTRQSGNLCYQCNCQDIDWYMRFTDGYIQCFG